ncbi:4'-phosphopantetheinyl transferase superfamily protein [Bifidobacterium sp. SMB2]|uniref:Holo-[acyl-carrier-protein] synthase n=1 Tax=Bifidobacterium saimiriisciurei TaxID=2661627 RepID=A0ABX0C8Z5_9BIFI|nr:MULTISPECIES: holo-ACP synthase [Bifidobacterium]NEG96313.1 4'-phosphopantetheinyl transferase superfamily protein [Bifidobacterium sp. SMB2]NEH11055.1 4'-phosphopantetheinyl transferase superfamily protein [Bifidobacterium saimiriisciurei]
MNTDSIGIPRPSAVLGLGHDVVDIAAFAEQLAEPGSRMRALFSSRELRQAALRARVKHDDESAHLAVRWAGKEAVLKAWSEALGSRPNPYTLDDFPWSGIEILDDSRGRPSVTLRAGVERTLHESLADVPSAVCLAWHISLSHDGPVASAVALLIRG